MKINALSVANYFIDLAHGDNMEIRPLGLLKRVYIAHGFHLAICDAPLLDSRFDKVEAWRYGPVIPSVYHSFKAYKNEDIKEKAIILNWDNGKDIPVFETPNLEDEDARDIVKAVWLRYRDYTDSQLVALTHRKGTPWAFCYREGENREIPDLITKLFYTKIFNKATELYEKRKRGE